MPIRSLRFLLVFGLYVLGCHSAAEQSPTDAAADVGDAKAHDASHRDGGAPSDGSVDHVMQEDGGVSPYGDRNLGVNEPYPSSVLIQNGGRFYDVTQPPTSAQHAAKGDGTTDDTQAIRDAFDYLKAAYLAANPTGSPTIGYDGSNYWVYFPDGTYRVTSTLTYTGMTLGDAGFDDLVRVRIVGQSREGVILRLDDKVPAFGNASSPAVLLEFQHDGTPFNNAPATNVLTNVTIDTGSGNPGAVGLWFQGANMTSMHNVKITSGDGAGYCGIWLQTGSVQGYFRDITVSGYDYGICQTNNPEFDSAFEHVTLTAQQVAGVLAQGGGMSLRAFDIDESKTHAEGLRLEKTGAVVFLDSSSLSGAKDAGAIDRTAATQEALFVRNVVTSYGTPLLQAGEASDADAHIGWFASSPPVVLEDSGIPPAPLGLPVEDTPLPTWYDPKADWADVDSYGAKGDGTTDDSAAIQSAMSSGKPVVVFPKTAYLWKTTVTIPASVTRVDFMYADVNGGLSIAEASTTPVRLSYHPGYGGVTLAANRPVVLADWSGDFGNPMAFPTKVYLENVSNIGADPSFAPAGQSTWARSLNDEQGGGATGDIVVDGGTLWLFGYKTENKPVTSVLAMNGARVEVLNGYVNMTEAPGPTPMIVNDHASLSYIGFTNLGSAIHGPFQVILSETQEAGTASLDYDAGFGRALPARGGVYAADFVVPLYVGRSK
jgi:Pectate lyase superfamily protein